MIPILNNGGISTSERVLLREDAVLFFVVCISHFYYFHLQGRIRFLKSFLLLLLPCFIM